MMREEVEDGRRKGGTGEGLEGVSRVLIVFMRLSFHVLEGRPMLTARDAGDGVEDTFQTGDVTLIFQMSQKRLPKNGIEANRWLPVGCG
jgi:hypothetical protein